ncbi:MAG: T9SS type A sorting domain-containing protein [Bacteroidetes bacterium]|nr:T9SS type A sorting domain-containing protein [Bacteroidota bacterium]
MKKILLFTLVFSFGLFTMAQKEIKSYQANFNQKIGVEPVKETPLVNAFTVDQPTQNTDRDTDIVTIISIGTSANAYSYGYGGGQKDIVAYHPDLNVLTNFHRMGGSLDPTGYSGDLGYDISFDGGMTWENMIECYVATENAGGEYFTDAARYPNHGLWDSDGTVEGAYVVYFCPNLDQTNGASWGGYSYGIVNTADTSIRTKNLKSSDPDNDLFQYIPDGYTLTSQGLSIATDINQDWTSGSVVYAGNIIVNKGYYDEGEEDFIYEQEFLDLEIAEGSTRPSFSDVAFSKDGMTGYIVTIGDNDANEVIGDFRGYYPIFWKTTDGGENWEGPTAVQLDGPNGLGGIVYHLIDDETYAAFFEDTPREELGYTTGFDMDVAVDYNGDLHIAVAVGATSTTTDYSISSNEGLFGIMDIYTTDGGTSWYAEIMGHPQCFRGNYPDDTYTEDNRVQITTNADHNRLFISWLDTDIEDQDDNNRPNIYARGFNPATLMKTVDAQGADAPFNVTFLSTAWRAAHFAIAANYSIDDNGTYTIPYTYMEMDVEDVAQPVQYKYIQDFSFSEADFTIQSVNENIASSNLFKVSQNYPNPVMGDTYFTVSLDEGSQLNLEVYSLTGQLVSTRNLGYKSAGSHTVTMNASDLSAGVYFYTVSAGVNKVTHKMIVQ